MIYSINLNTGLWSIFSEMLKIYSRTASNVSNTNVTLSQYNKQIWQISWLISLKKNSHIQIGANMSNSAASSVLGYLFALFSSASLSSTDWN